MSNKSGISSQVISLPKGGGALHGIGEKFSPDLHTGTGNFTIPITLPPGRNGFQPQLNLLYSTGNGNGPFGLGWSVSIPGVSRQTTKGVPRYNDATDTFVLSGAEDLVQVEQNPQCSRYQPRTEGLFAKILHHHSPNNNYWEVKSKDGLVSFYGTAGTAGNDPAVIAKPTDSNKIFAWKLTRTQDAFSNRVDYLYEKREEQLTDGPHQWDQLYLKEIRYIDFGNGDDPEFLIKVRFKYEERPDPFSEYRPGFEIRTILRCSRIEVFICPGNELLTRTYRMVYLDQRGLPADKLPLNGISLLSKVEVEGHGESDSELLPPLAFTYSSFEPEKRDFFPIIGPDMPQGSLARPEYELADLFGNGLPDILEMNGTVRYWRNLGNGRFDRPRIMPEAPAGLQLANPSVQLIDANGEGHIDLLVNTPGLSGYFPLGFDGLWNRKSFQRYEVAPGFNLEDPEVKLVDLTGDGVTDAIRSGSRMECYFSHPLQGWNETRWVERQSIDIFPNINFSDPRVKWGDMTGDGLQDILVVYDGNVEYWPNLGYGNWGKRISMRNNPRFSNGYDPRRILVGDVDGDGLADIVYVDYNKVILWINQSGNSWSEPIEIKGTPPVSDMDAVRLADMLGTGVSGVLWSTDAGGLSRHHMFFLDFTGSVKPYLLTEMDNHMGGLTKVGYTSSINYYLEDEKRPETRWKTSLPFPVQVVAKVEVIDEISKGKLTMEYSYHHGYWDGGEREFRGFGRVEQRDTEVFMDFHATGLHPGLPFEAVTPKMFSPPLEMRNWFHQGPVGDEFGDWHELDYRDEFWTADPQVLSRPLSVTDFFKSIQDRRVKRDAFRALRGTILRTELYTLDGTDFQDRPYTVTESIHGVREEAHPPENDRDRKHIFFPYALAERTTQWERGHEPMTQFKFMGDYDPYGQLLSQIGIAVPRNRDFRVEDLTAQSPYLSTYNKTTYAQRDDTEKFIVDRVARTTAYEVLNDGRSSLFQLWEGVKEGTVALKIIGQSLNFYDGEAFEGKDFGQLGDYGALVRSLSLVMTEEELEEAYGTERPPYLTHPVHWNANYPQEFQNQLPALAGYDFQPGGAGSPFARGYFVMAERRSYDFHEAGGEKRGLVKMIRDPLGHDTTIAYDEQGHPYHFLPVKVTDPLGLTTEAKYNYRVLQPREVLDPNKNLTTFTFTPLGLLANTFVKGKGHEGDQERPSVQMKYGLMAFEDSPPEHRQPIFVRTIRHIHHDTEMDVDLPKRDETITTVEYSDGFGRLLQTRTQAEEVLFGDPVFGGAILPIDQTDEVGTRQDVTGRKNVDPNTPNVVVSGWQTYDNKGRVVEKYEPFFSMGWDYRSPQEEKDQFNREVFGQQVAMFYDPRGQVIRTLNPDGSEQRVIHGKPLHHETPDQFLPTPWEAYTYDANDNAGRTHASAPNAKKYEHHWNTPSSIEIDALGRTIKTVARNREKPVNPGDPLPPIEEHTTTSTYDIRGNVLIITDVLEREAFKHVYDLANRKLKIISIDAGIRQVVMNAMGNPIEQWDGKGALSFHTYDVLDRPAKTWARDGTGQQITLRERLIYGDDEPGSGLTRDQATAKNLLNKPYRYYDEAGLLTFGVYDFKGNLLEKSRQVIRDEQILQVFNNAAVNQWQVSAWRINWEPPTGTSLEMHASTLLESVVYTTSMKYDAVNRIKVMHYPKAVDDSRKQLKPHYNRAGALEKVLLDDKTYVERIAYNAKGQRVLVAYGNGIMTRHAYDSQTFRLKRMRSERFEENEANPFTFHPTGSPVQDFAYAYDLVGNIRRIKDRTPGCGIPNTAAGINALEREFMYDALYRLRSATGRECDRPPDFPWDETPRCTDLTRTRAYTEKYKYDKADNIKQLKHLNNGNGFTHEFELIDGNNRLKKVSINSNTDFNYQYDDNGNLTVEGTTRHFAWNYADQMRTIRNQTGNAEPSVYAHYLYDATGQRTKKLVRKQGGRVEVTVYIDGIFEYQRIVRGGVTKEKNIVNVADNHKVIANIRIGDPLPDDTSPAIKFHLGDHLGSSNIVVSDSGQWVNREDYTPYGETSFGGFKNKRYRYSQKERDEESGLVYFGMRYYLPWLGRWVSCDPAGNIDGQNLYQYVRSNPIGTVDPMGLDSSDDLDGGVKEDMIPGGVQSDPYGGKEIEYRGDRNRIEAQDDFVKGAGAAVVNNVVDRIGPKPVIQHIKEKVATSVPVAGPMLADYLFNPLEKKIEPHYDKLKIQPPDSPAGGIGYFTGLWALNAAEMFVPGAANKLMPRSLTMPNAGALVEEMPTRTPQEYVPDLSYVTGKGAAARSMAIESAIAEDLPNVKLTYPPQYNPFIRTGIAKKGTGTQIGKEVFHDRLKLNETIIHEELHHRWWARGKFNHHPAKAADIKPWDRFHYTVDRYLQFRGFKTGVMPNSHRRAMERAAGGM